MNHAQQLNDELIVGPQPSPSELDRFADDGVKTVINLRTAGEDDQPLGPDAEAEEVKSRGMTYLHLPVSMGSLGSATVDEFRRAFKELPKPVLAHCKSGKRAGALAMMHLAVERGISGEKTLEQAEELGFECDQPELKAFVKQYVDAHTCNK
ncbi:Beta-lactamase hydrolase-like protein [Posidoniimonas polymericola]|uniref:Beta-lactamase hydrolase-like protein n=1 Tax=Posidoniimonas polymericola TaxID=2528002 RepID=A0A5C5YSF6_9BACT|nr:protein tyrosine phosphatase family protein [Posidoniimonas polymericola]TWT77885.1 Beta-lactamase hydrolase-like protein [Posidoniimonas polymericola]